MPCYVGCMLWCNLLQCFCYLMAFLVISFANNFENMVLVNFLFSFTRKKHPNNSSELLACSSDHNLQSGGPSYLFLWMASLSPPPPLPPPPPAQKKNAFQEVTEVITTMLCFPLTLFFLFFMQTLQKIALFCEPTLQTKSKLFMLPFFFLGFLPIVPYLGYFWWVSSLLSSSDWFEGLCKCGTFL